MTKLGWPIRGAEPVSTFLGSPRREVSGHVTGLAPNPPKLGEFLNSMCQHGLNGNIPAGKLWLALMFDWNEKKMFEILKNAKPSDRYDYSSLTTEELRTLEALLSKAKKVTDNSIQLIVNGDFLPDTSSIDNR